MWKYAIIVTIVCVISIIGNVLLYARYTNHPHEQQKTYALLSKSIRNEEKERNLIVNVTELRQSLFEQTASYSGDIGLYFDYMPTSTTIGINQRESFSLASLLKIPIAMAVLEKVSENKLSLDDRITVTPEMLNTHYGELWKKGSGYEITVKETLALLLKQSDNTASEILMSTITTEEMGQVFTAFDFPTLRQDDTLVITPKGYTSILRSLYYSTHLDPEYSNMILELLVGSASLDGRQSPLPSSVTYAHKIGVHDLTQTYSDCGVVYYPSHPYVLCVMVKNRSQQEAAAIIRSIVETTYTFIDTTVSKR